MSKITWSEAAQWDVTIYVIQVWDALWCMISTCITKQHNAIISKDLEVMHQATYLVYMHMATVLYTESLETIPYAVTMQIVTQRTTNC